MHQLAPQPEGKGGEWSRAFSARALNYPAHPRVNRISPRDVITVRLIHFIKLGESHFHPAVGTHNAAPAINSQELRAAYESNNCARHPKCYLAVSIYPV